MKKVNSPEKIILKYLIDIKNNVMIVKENTNLVLRYKLEKLNTQEKALSLEIINLADKILEDIYWSTENIIERVEIINIEYIRNEIYQKYNELVDKYKKLVNSITKK
jgi:hypothetical protein